MYLIKLHIIGEKFVAFIPDLWACPWVWMVKSHSLTYVCVGVLGCEVWSRCPSQRSPPHGVSLLPLLPSWIHPQLGRETW